MDILPGLGWRTWALAAHTNRLPLRATDHFTISRLTGRRPTQSVPPEAGHFGNRHFLLLLHYGVVHFLYPLGLVYVDKGPNGGVPPRKIA